MSQNGRTRTSVVMLQRRKAGTGQLSRSAEGEQNRPKIGGNKRHFDEGVKPRGSSTRKKGENNGPRKNAQSDTASARKRISRLSAGMNRHPSGTARIKEKCGPPDTLLLKIVGICTTQAVLLLRTVWVFFATLLPPVAQGTLWVAEGVGCESLDQLAIKAPESVCSDYFGVLSYFTVPILEHPSWLDVYLHTSFTVTHLPTADISFGLDPEGSLSLRGCEYLGVRRLIAAPAAGFDSRYDRRLSQMPQLPSKEKICKSHNGNRYI
ncbi:hypothetical protein C8R47DRAFT_1199453 [Mycena vitilis]|nr:hypothetical protein C8R47DRAFT_1199453 [Mycena vitilis]